MSILIKGMEMPTSCRACMYSRTDIRNVDWCVLTEKDLPCDCPIAPVPKHGRLIDADALEELFREVIGNVSKRDEIKPVLEHMVRASAMAVEMIKDAPTIIPADKEGDG